jgi:hypothetical protein
MISSGITGMMIPKPIESIRMVMKTKRMARRCGMDSVSSMPPAAAL